MSGFVPENIEFERCSFIDSKLDGSPARLHEARVYSVTSDFRHSRKEVREKVGTVSDIATLLKAVEQRCDEQEFKYAKRMLKARSFQLYTDIDNQHIVGVVKCRRSLHICRLGSNGEYACCTQNLCPCGSHRGGVCVHLLVLVIGLARAGKLDPAMADGWIAKTHDTRPTLNKEVMAEVFLRYKGAQAGEVDWRPTETLPEDYYSF